MSNDILKASKSMGVSQNVTIRVLDEATGAIIQEHVAHNTATNSLLTGIGHYLTGDGVFEQGSFMLSEYVPKYISLGTMGLISQGADENGWPTGIGSIIPEGSGELYNNLAAAEAALQQAKDNLAEFCPHFLETGRCYTGQACSTCNTRLNNLKQAVTAAEEAYNAAYEALAGSSGSEEQRFTDYMEQRPGYGADGYDVNLNNNRRYFGLGPVFVDRTVEGRTINCELISDSFPRADISFRDVVPEIEAELPKTIDVVFSALISTGALAQFREQGKDYVFITETGLWSKPDWPRAINYKDNPTQYAWKTGKGVRDYECGENGLLAAYRLAPPNKENWAMSEADVEAYIAANPGFVYPDDLDDKTPAGFAEYNRQLLKKNVLRVGVNQVVQVIWKIQIGSMDQFASGEAQEVVVEPLTITENGTYTASANGAYNPVEVNVPQTEIVSLNVTRNGTYDADPGQAYSPVKVNVEGGGGVLCEKNNIVGAESREGWIKIEAYTDLNTLTEVGIYYTAVSSDAETLINSPTVSGTNLFKMIIEHSINHNNWIHQVVYTAAKNSTVSAFRRASQDGGATWGDWIQENAGGQREPEDLNNIMYSGYFGYPSDVGNRPGNAALYGTLISTRYPLNNNTARAQIAFPSRAATPEENMSASDAWVRTARGDVWNDWFSLRSEYFGYDMTILAANTDLNTIITGGNYICTSVSDASTLVNSPTGQPGTLKVVKLQTRIPSGRPPQHGYSLQEWRSYNNVVYQRQVSHRVDGTVTSTPWTFSLSDDPVLITDLNDALTAGFYRYTSSAQNRPLGSQVTRGGQLVVLRWSASTSSELTLVQLCVPNYPKSEINPSSLMPAIFMRHRNTNEWGPWYVATRPGFDAIYMQELAVGTDLNDVKVAGSYRVFNTPSSIINSPTGGYGMLEVTRWNDSYTLQKWTTRDYDIYVRRLYTYEGNTTATPWKQIVMQ